MKHFCTSTVFQRSKPLLESEREEEGNNEEAEFSYSNDFTPEQVVSELNKYIVGQMDAKRAVAIALRNRWRRHRVAPQFRNEIIPKNILMIGPTGVGKTEIARRLAKLSDAPFVKAEATKYTEVGFHGRDVDYIIRDLVDNAIQQVKSRKIKQNKEKVQQMAEDYILDCLTGKNATDATRNHYLQLLREGKLEDHVIEVDLPEKSGRSISTLSSPIQESLPILQDIFSMIGGRHTKKRKMKIKNARPLVEEHESEKVVNMESVIREAIRATEQDGIVVIDEIDKICSPVKDHGHDASAEGVQRDLLPLIEGTVINTKYGNVNTDHILFIASGAFHSCKPSDMLAELQGRLPIRVELSGLTEEDLHRILIEPKYNILQQNIALLSTENVKLTFTDDSIREIARMAAEINSTVESIGARRLITVVEKILEDISFNAPSMSGQEVVVTTELVRERIKPLMKASDMYKFIL